MALRCQYCLPNLRLSVRFFFTVSCLFFSSFPSSFFRVSFLCFQIFPFLFSRVSFLFYFRVFIPDVLHPLFQVFFNYFLEVCSSFFPEFPCSFLQILLPPFFQSFLLYFQFLFSFSFSLSFLFLKLEENNII